MQVDPPSPPQEGQKSCERDILDDESSNFPKNGGGGITAAACSAARDLLFKNFCQRPSDLLNTHVAAAKSHLIRKSWTMFKHILPTYIVPYW